MMRLPSRSGGSCGQVPGVRIPPSPLLCRAFLRRSSVAEVELLASLGRVRWQVGGKLNDTHGQQTDGITRRLPPRSKQEGGPPLRAILQYLADYCTISRILTPTHPPWQADQVEAVHAGKGWAGWAELSAKSGVGRTAAGRAANWPEAEPRPVCAGCPPREALVFVSPQVQR